MSSRMGIPRVGLLLFETSGLLSSRPPGVFSQEMAPHMAPLHWATRTLATPSATRQSPVGSAAMAGRAPAPRTIPNESMTARMRDRGHCNMAQTCACVDGANKGKTPHQAFSVDEDRHHPKYVTDAEFQSRRFRDVRG